LARLVVQGKYFSHTGALSTICADGIDCEIHQNLVHYALLNLKAGEELTVDYSKYSEPIPAWLVT
jgi:hypothetical protein